MGCTQFSKKTVISSTISKTLSSDLLPVESSKTMSGTNFPSLQPSLKPLQSLSRPCYKVKIAKPFSKFILNEIQNFDSFGRMVNKVRKYWILLAAFQNSFEKETHAVCIENYSIKDGLNVLFVFLAVKLDCKLFNVRPSQLCLNFPTKVGDLPIVTAFKQLTSFISQVLDKNIVLKIEGYKKKFENLVLENEGKKEYNRTSALNAASEFLGTIKSLKQGISDYLKDFKSNQQRILHWASESNIYGVQSAGQIVHFIINK